MILFFTISKDDSRFVSAKMNIYKFVAFQDKYMSVASYLSQT